MGVVSAREADLIWNQLFDVAAGLASRGVGCVGKNCFIHFGLGFFHSIADAAFNSPSGAL